MLFRVRDLNPVHGGFNLAALRDEYPAVLVNATGLVAHDVPAVHQGIGTAAAQRAAPLGFERQAEGCVQQRRNEYAFQRFPCATIRGPVDRWPAYAEKIVIARQE